MLTDVIDVAPAAGWYHDPSDPASMRWWSGAGWTDYVSPIDPEPVPSPSAPVAAVPPAYAPAAAQHASTPAATAPAFAPAVTVPAFAPAAAAPGFAQSVTAPASADERWTSNYTADELQLYTSRGRSTAATQQEHRREFTADGRTLLSFERPLGDELTTAVPNGAAFAIAAIPLLGVLIALAIGGLQAVGAIPENWTGSALGIGLWVAGIAMATLDAKNLRSVGLPSINPAWALLGAFVFTARRSWVLRGRPGVSGPMVLASIATVLQVLVAVASVALIGFSAALGLPGSAGPGASGAISPQRVERSIEKDLAANGQAGWTVDCSQADVQVSANSSFQCDASTVDGRTGIVAVATDAQGTTTFTLTARG